MPGEDDTMIREPENGIDINEQFRLAPVDIMEDSDRGIFITGRAGTGKSTLLNYFRHVTGKKVAVLAPTGVAALNVKGQTIHSFFRFKPGITPDQIKRRRSANSNSIFFKLDAIIIDEISMVRADLLDCIDRFLRLNGPEADKPFGGIQMAFIGDLYQLPPVVTGGGKAVFQSFTRRPTSMERGCSTPSRWNPWSWKRSTASTMKGSSSCSTPYETTPSPGMV